MNEPENMMNDNQANLLREMGIGPVWKLRHDAPVPVALAAPSVQLSGELSGQLSEVLNDPLNESQTVVQLAAAVSPPNEALVLASAIEPEVLAFAEETKAETTPPAQALVQVTPEPEPPAVAVVAATAAATAAAMEMPDQSVSAAISASPCLCGLSGHPDDALFDAKNLRPDYLFVYCDAIGGDRPGGQSADSARILFENMLQAIGVAKGNRAYLSNVLTHVSEDGSASASDTVLGADYSVCLPCLKRQIKLIQPAVIVALGSAVSSALLGSGMGPIAGLRGRLQQFEDVPLVVTTDPRYLLSRPLEKAKAWSDLCLAMSAASPA